MAKYISCWRHMVRRRLHPGSQPLLDDDKDSPSYCVPGNVPAS
jgi:hypothetical protein